MTPETALKKQIKDYLEQYGLLTFLWPVLVPAIIVFKIWVTIGGRLLDWVLEDEI